MIDASGVIVARHKVDFASLGEANKTPVAMTTVNMAAFNICAPDCLLGGGHTYRHADRTIKHSPQRPFIPAVSMKPVAGKSMRP
jgi:hypothetical protein